MTGSASHARNDGEGNRHLTSSRTGALHSELPPLGRPGGRNTVEVELKACQAFEGDISVMVPDIWCLTELVDPATRIPHSGGGTCEPCENCEGCGLAETQGGCDDAEDPAG